MAESKKGSLEWLLLTAFRAGEESVSSGTSYDDWRRSFLPDDESIRHIRLDEEPRCGKPYLDKNGDLDTCSFPARHVGSCW